MNNTKIAPNGSKKQGTNGKTDIVPVSTIEKFQETEKPELIKDLGILDKSIRAFKITDDKTRSDASVLLSSVKTKIKEVEKKEDTFLDPIKDLAKKIKGEFKPIKDSLLELEVIIKKEQIRDYTVQEEIRIKTEKAAKELEAKQLAKLNEKLTSENPLDVSLAKNKAEQIRQNTETKMEAVAVKTNISTSVGSTQIRKIWTYEVLNPNEVPVEYKVIDSALVNSAIKDGKRNIPGLRIYEKPIVAGRVN